MAAAARRHVGDVPGAEPLEQLAELGGLAVDVAAGQVQVEHQHPPGAEPGSYTGTVHGWPRRLGRQRPGMPGRVGAAAVREIRTCGVPAIEGVTARQAASAAARERPSGLAGSAVADTRRVARGQC